MANTLSARKGVKNTCIFQLTCSNMMLQRLARPSLPSRQGLPSFFPWGDTQPKKGKISVKAAECGCKRSCNLTRTRKMTDSTPSPPPGGPRLASGPGKLLLYDH